MKKDIKLIRNILLDIEAAAPGEAIQGFEYEGKSQPEILEHVQLLKDAGFIEALISKGGQNEPVACVVWRMTWAGQEFLANAKNDTVWKKVVAQAEEKGMSTSMGVLNGLLEAAAKKYAGLE
jgi:hypothetical protein